MQNKLFHKLLLLSLLGTALWFFGNLYEGVVIGPNLLKDSIRKAYHWQNFFTETNPVFFYIPLSPLSTILLFFLYFKTPKDSVLLKRQLKFGSLFLAMGYALSIYIITQINLIIFNGDLNKYAGVIHSKAVLWNVLNDIRLVFVAIALAFVFKAYIQTQKNI